MKRLILIATVVLLAAVWIPSTLAAPLDLTSACANIDIQSGPLAKVGGDLAALYCDDGGELAQGNQLMLDTRESRDGTRYVMLDVVVAQGEDSAELLTELQALGLQRGSVFGAVVSGQFPINAIGSLSQSQLVRFARPTISTSNVGSVQNEAVIAMQADDLSSTLVVSGTGVTIGIISDSYGCENNTNTTVAQDIASGDLPATINIVQESFECPNTIDEGRAMAQLIHDIAPGSDLAFHAAFNDGQAGLANAILALADDAQGNADIIVDDVAFLTEPFFQDGIVAQAVDQVVDEGIAYFSSAGNAAAQAYASPFNSERLVSLSGVPLTTHGFATGDDLQLFTMPANSVVAFSLQWANPYASATGGGGATSEIDALVFPAGQTNAAFGNLDNNLGGDPVAFFVVDNSGQPAQQFELMILHRSGPEPSLIKYQYALRQGQLPTFHEFATDSPTVFGHANAQGAIAVGAAFFGDTPEFGVDPAVPEPFSSLGGEPVLFDLQDNPINEVREQPKFLAPDGVSNTFFGAPVANRTGPFLFFGTSAAAPNLAALAALMQSATNVTLTPAQIVDLLKEGTPQAQRSAYDPLIGFGMVQSADIIDDLQGLNTPTSVTLSSSTTQPAMVDTLLASLVILTGVALLHRRATVRGRQ